MTQSIRNAKAYMQTVESLKGQVIEAHMLTIKGPGGGLQPMYLDIVFRKKSPEEI